MKLTGTIGVTSKTLAVLNVRQKRPSWSCLSLGRYPGKNELYLLLQTRENWRGKRYKVAGNIRKIIACDSKTKATIGFHDPEDDVYITADQIALQKFLKLLRNHLFNVGDENELTNLATLPAKIPPKDKSKFVAKIKGDLPGDEGYGRSLEIIEINDCSLKNLDRRILRLQNLKVLNLKGNDLESIPEQIDLLPNLRELNLANNNFNSCRNWKWLAGEGIKNNLRHLSLRENMLEFFPLEICKLTNLKTIDVTKNNITVIPNNIGWLHHLKNFLAEDNPLKCLPANVCLLRLERVEVSFVQYEVIKTEPEKKPRDLVDIAGVVCLHLHEEFDIKITKDLIPAALLNYIESAGLCFCREYVLPPKNKYIRSHPKYYIHTNMLQTGHISYQKVSFGLCYQHFWCNFME